MNKKKTSRALIVKNNKILLIHRKKQNREYYVIPGGELNNGETPEEALIREIKEETSLDIISFKKFTEIEDERKHGIYYFVDKFIGTPKIIGEELKRISPINQFYLEWIEITQLKNFNIIPVQLKSKLLEIFE